MDESADLTDLRRAGEVFQQALDLPEPERRLFVAKACGGSPALVGLVARLLEAHAASGRFMSRLDLQAAAELLEEADGEAALGISVGPYRIVREVGRGGMGSVYLAERADGAFEQRVALKLVKRGMGSKTSVERFLRERQILAQLEHPNIARLLDGGVAGDGRPYFAMEYVEGIPLTAHCDRERLGIDARLRLFETVCTAVQHAHRNLVVHRDIKPANVLVTRRGEVKLLDFGIAKLLAEGGSAPRAQTLDGPRALTPEYAAPEQIRGEAVTTATDVYALGVTLYELLSGSRPYLLEDRGYPAVAQAVCETEPGRPSMAVGQAGSGRGAGAGSAPEQIARARGTTPERLRKRLAGDLDTVILKALRKEPERRYASAEALAEDLRRHRQGLPVQARPDTLAYRASRFVRRHRLGVTATLLVVLTLVGGLAATAYQARAKAKEAAKAEEIKDFLTSLFTLSDPDESKGKALSARDLLDEGMERIDLELSTQPEVLAEMLSLIGDLYTTLDAFDAAEAALDRSLELRRSMHGGHHRDVAESLYLLGRLHAAKGDLPRAEALYREALALQRTLLGSEHLEVASSLAALAALLTRRDRFEEAERTSREALHIGRRRLGPEHPSVAASMHRLARVLHKRGVYTDEPDSLFRRALDLRRRHFGELHSAVVETMATYSSFLQDAGRLDEAEGLIRGAVLLGERLYGADNSAVADTRHNFARLLKLKGDFDGAEVEYLRALEIYRRALGADHLYVGVTLYDLGTLRLARGDPEGAEPLLREALELYRAHFGNEHHYVAMNLHRLGSVHHARGEPRKAEALLRESLAIYRRTLSDGHPVTGTSLIALGSFLLAQGRAAEAEPLLREGEASWTLSFSEDDERLLGARHELARCWAELGRLAEARALLERIHAVYRTAHGETDAGTVAVEATLEVLGERMTADPL